MNDAAQTVVAVAAVFLGGLLAVRLLVPALAVTRRTLRPETRAIRVVGVGGGGSNAVDRMVAAQIPGVSFVACNTDAQALRGSTAGVKVRIGEAITRGLGSGGDPDVGRRAAEEDEAKIARTLADADLVFITAGLGGGTGSGAAPIVGASARAQGALTIAVVTRPFAFEGAHRRRIADTALAELAASVDAIITIPNDRVAEVVADDTSMLAAFRVVDDVLLQAVRGIIELLSGPGLINLDFADVRAVMLGAGPAIIGLGSGSGENRAIEAARQAIASPLLEASIQGARGILFNISGPADLRLSEVRIAADEIRANADPDANVIFGASLTRPAGEDVLITLIATGLQWPKDADVVTRATERSALQPKIIERPMPSERPVEAEVPVHANGGPKSQPRVATEPRSAAVLREAHRVHTDVSLPSNEGHPPPDAAANQVVDLEVPSFLRRRQPS
ncbi:MAG: cell division protein FtsZ [Chloroflexota bacterium]